MAEFDIITSKVPAGLSVIEASAGTGKTYALSHLVPRLLLDGSVASIGQILLVTFTNDAARELSDRTRKVL
jgi:exodeoxyribonuclease V beta subunit